MNTSLSNTRNQNRLVQSSTCRRHKTNLFMSMEVLPKRHLTEQQINEKCQQLHKQGVKFRAKRQEASKKQQQKREVEQMKQCTFQPTIAQTEYFVPKTPFLQRQQTWDKSRTDRILKKQQDKKKCQLKNCSFKPELISASSEQLNVTRLSSSFSQKACNQKGSYLQIYKSRKQPKKLNRHVNKKPSPKPTLNTINKQLQQSADTKDEQDHQEVNPEKHEETNPVIVQQDNDVI